MWTHDGEPAGATILTLILLMSQQGCCQKPCSTNSSELVLFVKSNSTNIVIDLRHRIVGGTANGAGAISLSLLNESDDSVKVAGTKLIVGRAEQDKEDPIRLTLLCVYLEENEEIVVKDIPVIIMHNGSHDSENETQIAENSLPFWNGSLVNSSHIPTDIPANIKADRRLNDAVESRDGAKVRTQRQAPQPLLVPTVPASATDKPPSFLHPDCRPFGGVCADVEYSIHVQPGIVPGIQPLQTSPRTIEAQDLEIGRAITYKFINGTPSNYEMYFFMDPSSAAVSQVRPVPFGEVDNYVIYFMATEAGPTALSSVARLTIHVDNGVENAHDPVLETSALRGYIEENSQIGTTVRIAPEENSPPLQILVTDEDLKPGMAPATYQYILMGIGASVFAVNQGGYVYLNAPTLDVDGASPKTYALTIQAREVGTAPIRSSQPLSIKIDVLDVNDNEPSFERQVFQATALADLALQDVLKVEAKDGDSSKFGELQYSIISVTNNGERFFRYNKDSHSLVSIAPLTAGDQYQVLLQATDGGGRSGQTIIVVDVVTGTTSVSSTETTTEATTETMTQAITTVASESTMADTMAQMTTTRPPPYSPTNMYNVTISEAAPMGTAVVRLGSDGHEKLQYQITKGNEEKKFRLDSETGTMSTAATLDREITSSYKLSIQAVGTTINETVTVTVNVGDENDNAPVFTNAKPIVFYLEDGSPADAFVGRLRVEDADPGQNGAVKLSIDSSSPSASDFVLDSSDGTLRTKNVLKAAEKSSHHLRVVARDGGAVPKESAVDVEIRVVDKSSLLPYFVNDNYVIEIDENVGPRELVTVVATAPTVKGPVTYVLKQGDPTLFAVDAASGTVSTLANLDAEQRRIHSLIIGTKQNYETTPGAVANIEVRVKDINDWIPIFQPQSYAATLVDSVQVGTPVLQVTAVDQDAEETNNVVRYRLTGYGNATQFFSIDPLTGVISVKRPLKNARNNELTLLVEARDNGLPPLSSTATAAIQIQRMQPEQNPVVVETPTVRAEVPLTTATMSPVPTVPTTTNAGAVKFSSSQYSLSLAEGSDGAGFLRVLRVEGKPSNLLGLQCKIVSGNYGGVIDVNANSEGDCELRLRGVVDRETVDRYNLNVSVSAPGTNGQNPIDYARVLVEITDVNDNAPRFLFDDSVGVQKTYFAAMAPEAPPGSHVITVKAVDPDAEGNNKVVYALDSTSPDHQYFTIDANSGEIKNAMVLPERSKSQKAYFEFYVESKDTPASGQALESKADVVVNLVTDSHRFVMTLDGVRPAVVERYVPDIKRSMQSRVGECKALGVESMRETSDLDVAGTDVTWYAINPLTKTICRHDEFDMLFEKTNIDRIKGELSGWLNVRQLRQAVGSHTQVLTAGVGADESGGGGLFSQNRWQAAEIALVVLACVIVVGAIIGILAMCYFWSRYKTSRVVPTDRVQLYSALPKYNALILPPSEKEYETQFQIMEMAVPAERALDKILDTEFSMEDGIYSVHMPGKFDIFAQRQPPSHVYIPPPDYPSNGSNGHGGINGNGAMSDMNGRRPAVPAPAQRKRNTEKTTIL